VRAGFHADLDRVNATLVEMADGATDAMRTASRSLLSADSDLAQQVIDGDEAIDVRYRTVEEQLSELLARQSPVAGDLRLVVAALHAAGDLERMGDLAVHVARTAQRRAPDSALVPEVRSIVTAMSECTCRIGEKVTRVLRTIDATVAAELENDDDAIDTLERELFSVLLEPGWPHGVAPAIDAAQLGRWYERFADHSVNAGRRVIYFVTGT